VAEVGAGEAATVVGAAEDAAVVAAMDAIGS
jgi:hypothetical protein